MGEKRGKIERENKEEKDRRNCRERVSTFSIGFPAIDSSNSGEIRSKVDPHCKSYAWVPVLWSFDKLREVGVFSYLIYSLAKSRFNGWGYLEAWMAVFSVPKFELSEEIPSVVMDSFETVGLTVHVTLCVVVCY